MTRPPTRTDLGTTLIGVLCCLAVLFILLHLTIGTPGRADGPLLLALLCLGGALISYWRAP